MAFLQALQANQVAFAVVALSLAAVIGIGIGSIRVFGINLGIAGALFSGIALGHFGLAPDRHILEFAREFGLILFVYTIGIQVGPGFFSSLKKDGLPLNLAAAAIVVLGVLVTVAVYFLFDLPLPVALGLFSGAVTNTPSLAAGQQVLHEVGAQASDLALPGMGYAVAYPFGILGILITMLLVRFVLRIKIDAETKAFEENRAGAYCPLDTMNIVVENPSLAGVTMRDFPGLAGLGVVVSRVLHDGSQEVAKPDHVVAIGDVLLAVGPKDKLEQLKRICGGVEAEIDLKKDDSNIHWERVVVTNSKILGKTIAEADFRHTYGVTVSRLNRAGVELVPAASLALQFGDILTVIGHPDELKKVSKMVGNKPSLLQHAQIAPIFLGILLGVLVGSIPLQFPGMPAPLKLGLAGGPLIVAIVLARIGHLGPLVWFMPPATNLAIREIGIILFLSAVGLMAGGKFVQTAVSEQGLTWMGLAALITLIPLLIVGFFGRLVMKLNYLSLCGLLSGSMTDPPALAFANAIAPSEAPALAYSTVYPLVMFLRVMAPQILVLLLWQ